MQERYMIHDTRFTIKDTKTEYTIQDARFRIQNIMDHESCIVNHAS
ncbi:MAG: hypothetical protein HY754_04085 [Nitrospirae bacterium]|nr:hypothetical protein [Nitrospirota bacterium]